MSTTFPVFCPVSTYLVDGFSERHEPAVMLDIGGNVGALAVGQEHERMVTTLLMTDIVDSTSTEVRIGVHTGEVSLVAPGEIGGIAVHATARIMALAGKSEVFVSGVTRGLTDGAELSFEDVGPRDLKGFDRPIEVARLLS